MKYLLLIIILPHLNALEIKLPENKPLNSAIRSLIFPGWGQYSNNQQKKCYIIAGIELASISSAYYYYNTSNKIYEDYEKKGIKDDSLYDQYSEAFIYSQALSILAVLTWIYSITDAYLSAKKQYITKNSNWKFICQNNKIFLNYIKSW